LLRSMKWRKTSCLL